MERERESKRKMGEREIEVLELNHIKHFLFSNACDCEKIHKGLKYIGSNKIRQVNSK